MTNPRFVGLWRVDPSELYLNASANRWYLYNDGLHEGPVLKFKGFDGGLPDIGAAVHVGIRAVECLQRGWMGHRPPIHWELTITPYRGTRHEHLEALRIVREDPGIGSVCRIHGDAWLLRGEPELREKIEEVAIPTEDWVDRERVEEIKKGIK